MVTVNQIQLLLNKFLAKYFHPINECDFTNDERYQQFKTFDGVNAFVQDRLNPDHPMNRFADHNKYVHLAKLAVSNPDYKKMLKYLNNVFKNQVLD